MFYLLGLNERFGQLVSVLPERITAVIVVYELFSFGQAI